MTAQYRRAGQQLVQVTDDRGRVVVVGPVYGDGSGWDTIAEGRPWVLGDLCRKAGRVNVRLEIQAALAAPVEVIP